MQKVITVNPLDGDDRSDLNRLLNKGWSSLFYLPINKHGNIVIYYHLIKQEEEEVEVDDEDDTDDIDGMDDTDLENNWRVD